MSHQETLKFGIFHNDQTHDLRYGTKIDESKLYEGYFLPNGQMFNGIVFDRTNPKNEDAQVVEIGSRNNGNKLHMGYYIRGLDYLEAGTFDRSGISRGCLIKSDSVSVGDFNNHFLINGIQILEKNKPLPTILHGTYSSETGQLVEGHLIRGNKIRIYERGCFNVEGRLVDKGVRVEDGLIQQGEFVNGHLTKGVTLSEVHVAYQKSLLDGKSMTVSIDKEKNLVYIGQSVQGQFQGYRINFNNLDTLSLTKLTPNQSPQELKID